jgi:hypothetical protein
MGPVMDDINTTRPAGLSLRNGKEARKAKNVLFKFVS